MDVSSLLGTLLSGDSAKTISKRTKTDSADVTNVLGAALPLLLNGAKEQSENKETASGFAAALAQHGKEDTSSLSGFLGKVDLDDGAKIVQHLLGSQSQTAEIAKKSGVSADKTASILSAAAPLLMSLLGKESQNASGSAGSGLMGALLQNVDVGDVLTSLLGGGKTSSGKKTGKNSKKKDNDGALDVLGDVLGSLLK